MRRKRFKINKKQGEKYQHLLDEILTTYFRRNNLRNAKARWRTYVNQVQLQSNQNGTFVENSKLYVKIMIIMKISESEAVDLFWDYIKSNNWRWK